MIGPKRSLGGWGTPETTATPNQPLGPPPGDLSAIDPAIVWSCATVASVAVVERYLMIDPDDRSWRQAGRWIAALGGAGAIGRWTSGIPSLSMSRKVAVRTIVGCAVAASWGRRGPSSVITDRLVTIATCAPLVSVWVAGSPDLSVDLNSAERVALVSSTMFPGLLASCARARRGADPRWAQVAWGPFVAFIGSAGLRSRARARRRVTERWETRTRPQLESYRLAAKISAATRSTPGHDFKKVLAALGFFGSEAAREKAGEQMVWPAQQQRPGDGLLLGEAVGGRPLQPVGAGSIWLAPGQAARVAEFLAHHDANERARFVRVERDVAVLHISVGEHTLHVGPDSWAVAFLLDSFSLGVGTFSTFRLAMIPVYPAAPIATLFARLVDATAVRLRSEGALGRHTAPIVVSVMMGGAAVEAWFAARDQARWLAEGRELKAQPFFTFYPVVFAMLALWKQLGRTRNPLVATLAALMAGTLRRSRVPWYVAVRSLASMLPTVVPTYSIRSIMEDDAAALETRLSRSFERDITDAHRRAALAELARFEEQVTLAEAELDRLGGEIPDAIADELRSECASMRAWLEGPTALSDLVTLSPNDI